MQLPISLKYHVITQGPTQRRTDNEVEYPGYACTDPAGVVVFTGTSLPDVIQMGLEQDRAYERASQYVDRKLPEMDHLKDADIDDRPSGVMVPKSAFPEQGGGNILN